MAVNSTRANRSAMRGFRTNSEPKTADQKVAAQQAKALGSTLSGQGTGAGMEGALVEESLRPAWNDLPPEIRDQALKKGRR